MRSTIYLIAGILVLAVTACGGNGSNESFLEELYESTHTIYIDNGIDTSATIVITGADTTIEMQLAGFGVQAIELKARDYHVTATSALDSLFLDEDFTVDGESYIYNLNLTKQDYIMEVVTYIVSENPELYSTHQTFNYKGESYEDVDAKVIPGQLLVPSSWDYNLEDEMPEEVTIEGDNNTTIRTKLYRSGTFVLFLELYKLYEGMNLEAEAAQSEF